MGISLDSMHKRRATGGKPMQKHWRKKRKYEMGRQPANNKTFRVRKGNLLWRLNMVTTPGEVRQLPARPEHWMCSTMLPRYEMGRQPANTKDSSNKRFRRIRIRRGKIKWRALKRLRTRLESWMWSTMLPTIEQKHLLRVPLLSWTLLPSSSGISCSLVLRLFARRTMPPRRKESKVKMQLQLLLLRRRPRRVIMSRERLSSVKRFADLIPAWRTNLWISKHPSPVAGRPDKLPQSVWKAKTSGGGNDRMPDTVGNSVGNFKFNMSEIKRAVFELD